MTFARQWELRIAGLLAGGIFLALLASLLHAPHVPRLFVAALATLAAASALRPGNGLLLLAAAIPIATWVGRQWNPQIAWPETLVVAFCAGYCLRVAATRPRRADALEPPIVVTAAVIAASLVAQLLIDGWRFGGAAMRESLWTLIESGYFVGAEGAGPIDAAMRLLECLIIFRAAATVAAAAGSRADDARANDAAPALRFLAWVVTGAALAAAINLLRLWESAARTDAPLAAFVNLFLTQRFNVHYGDVNAAGSYFVLTLFAALALAVAPRGRRWAIAVLLIASSIWITSSRAAMMFAVLAALLPAAALVMHIRRRGIRRTTLAIAAVTIALLAGAAAYALPERGNQKSALVAAQVRLEMARTSLRMTAASPWFGVGVGRYYSRSGEFSSPELLALFPPAIRENAHNNFLQFLAELGVVGFAGIIWLLATAAIRLRRLVAASPRDPVRWLLVTGVTAFVLSWFAGHPLLIDDVAFSFWLVLGAMCGWSLAVSPAAPARPQTWLAAALVPLTMLSVPWRVHDQRADFDLEHRGVGLSHWQPEIDGVRYRLAGDSSSVFLPSDARVVVVPLRSVSIAPEARVEILLDGRAADAVNVTSDRWHLLRLQMPQGRDLPRFRRLELRVTPSGDSPILMVGKVEPR